MRGGGAHGAFTWGVLEALLEDGRFDFHTITATSAGAMNGAIFATGLLHGGPKEAINLLESFWHKVSEAGRFGIFSTTNALQQMMGPFGKLATGAYMGLDMLATMFSPYQFNPMGYNPLRDIIAEMVDFPLLQKSKDLVLHVCATEVTKCHLKIFSGKELSTDALLASACLPQLFQAVEIDGNYYWDGGYMGNPPLFPITHSNDSRDILIVQIDPVLNANIPRTGEAIADRLNEISFNSPLLMELRGIENINQLLRDGHLNEKTCGLREFYIHIIGDDEHMADLSLESKFNPEWGFLNGLREAGHRRAQAWIKENFAKIGQRSTAKLGEILALDP
jgi:NTE family protein